MRESQLAPAMEKKRVESTSTLDRNAAGLSWMVAPPQREREIHSDTIEAPKGTVDDEDNAENRIEKEVKEGLRDPVSKLPYGLFQPKKTSAGMVALVYAYVLSVLNS